MRVCACACVCVCMGVCVCVSTHVPMSVSVSVPPCVGVCVCVSVSVSATVCMHKCGYEIANRRIQHDVTRSWHIHDNDGPQGKLIGWRWNLCGEQTDSQLRCFKQKASERAFSTFRQQI